MRWWRGLNSLLFMRCRDAAPLISQRMDRPLSPEEEAGLSVHLALCPSCRQYRGQMALLRRVMRMAATLPPAAGRHALTSEARSRIREGLETGGAPD